MNLISVIVTTYNWPAALRLCLDSLFAQQGADFEIIIADDGSNSDNLVLNRSFCSKSPVPLKYAYHEDLGFRAAAIRNQAVALSQGDYLLFIDGDCILPTGFILSHKKLASFGHFVPGNRVLLNKRFTQEVIDQALVLHGHRWFYFLKLRLQGKINRISAFLSLPLGFLRTLQPRKWQKAMTCNLGVWRNDFVKVNGFDEQFEGWGYEDSDLIIRLINAGIKRKEGRFAVPVLHLWHPQNDRKLENLNYQRLMERLSQPDFILAKKGFSSYLE